MGEYSINDFQIGDSVYHLSNTGLIMIVIEININRNEVSCRWVAKAGTRHVEEFLPQELGKASDFGPGIYAV
jgi:uncharacterized protein YodC (DUF2158 family)